MKQLDDQTWWNYIDGECSDEEKSRIEKLLADDSSAKEEFLLRNALHLNLEEGKLEEPSFNFASKVMAALPDSYTTIHVEPIISPFWNRVFLSILAFLTLGSIGLALNTPTATKSVYSQYISDGTHAFLNLFSYIPASVGQFLIITMLGVGLLFCFDILMKRRFQRLG